MKKNGLWASPEQDDHLNRPIHNVLSSTPAGKNIGWGERREGGGMTHHSDGGEEAQTAVQKQKKKQNNWCF